MQSGYERLQTQKASLDAAADRMWHMQDSQGQIMALNLALDLRQTTSDGPAGGALGIGYLIDY